MIEEFIRVTMHYASVAFNQMVKNRRKLHTSLHNIFSRKMKPTETRKELGLAEAHFCLFSTGHEIAQNISNTMNIKEHVSRKKIPQYFFFSQHISSAV